jgi:hypothetical protein
MGRRRRPAHGRAETMSTRLARRAIGNRGRFTRSRVLRALPHPMAGVKKKAKEKNDEQL